LFIEDVQLFFGFVWKFFSGSFNESPVSLFFLLPKPIEAIGYGLNALNPDFLLPAPLLVVGLAYSSFFFGNFRLPLLLNLLLMPNDDLGRSFSLLLFLFLLKVNLDGDLFPPLKAFLR
jgi:hypothetical protein